MFQSPSSRVLTVRAFFPVRQAPCWAVEYDVLFRCARHPQVRFRFGFRVGVIVRLTLRISVFRTSHYDVNINETSSYVDLSPLYGHNQEAQDKVRSRDGRGTLYPDVFAEDRLLLLPPAVCVILVLFNRNHNVSLFFSKPVSEPRSHHVH